MNENYYEKRQASPGETRRSILRNPARVNSEGGEWVDTLITVDHPTRATQPNPGNWGERKKTRRRIVNDAKSSKTRDE
ncbi:unnamed protein product [Macrosiphum euphorbiae]|uniref:Uncharacterized protein n=1 Tax=Macrosiphum euphorbiae TaxID=13131 RepID=A0AAV0XIB9_9HEMI|nr:unnamed protein product [Macrosiphum euphorbiae]